MRVWKILRFSEWVMQNWACHYVDEIWNIAEKIRFSRLAFHTDRTAKKHTHLQPCHCKIRTALTRRQTQTTFRQWLQWLIRPTSLALRIPCLHTRILRVDSRSHHSLCRWNQRCQQFLLRWWKPSSLGQWWLLRAGGRIFSATFFVLVQFSRAIQNEDCQRGINTF